MEWEKRGVDQMRLDRKRLRDSGGWYRNLGRKKRKKRVRVNNSFFSMNSQKSRRKERKKKTG